MAAAKAAVDQAQAAVDQVNAALDQAKAARAVLEVQLTKTLLSSPLDGVASSPATWSPVKWHPPAAHCWLSVSWPR